ncbi:alpha/beta hydrolase [Streptomyces iconiensis]|uniref:Alpha/beta hydrolase n=1 Tax=Streptomyces iconiensis TaxID=1384038 RepID=A0ABT6ZWE0_9ACTN|nr:alpha/beta hydrolase [Streptomyces iconiensis]MDJ1133388.1 alpha/beta hydrolase [Streptomyces iconiensis]
MGSHAKDKLNDGVAPKMRESLDGDAVKAATGQVGKLSENFHYTQVRCGLVRANVQLLKEALEEAKRMLKKALQSADTEGFEVNPDGSVSYPPAGEKGDGGKVPEGGTVTGTVARSSGKAIDPGRDASNNADALKRQAQAFSGNPNATKAQAIADDIAAAVKTATTADETYAPVLRGLKADDDLNVSDADWADTKRDTTASRKAADKVGADLPAMPEDGNPKDSKAWWDGLSRDDKDSYIALHPSAVGAMDGLPAEVRDEANRMKLAEAHGTTQTELAGIKAKEPEKFTRVGAIWTTSGEWREWNEKYGDRVKALEGRRKGMDAVQARFDKTGKKGLPQAYLLGFDSKGEGDGKVILANGNPDEAKHTVVHVPGTSTNLKGIGGTLDSMDGLWAASHKAEPNASVSTITWFDYDAPDDIPQYVPNTGNTGQWAEDGAPTLQKFMEGTEVSQGGADASHTTVSGHSYGSTVVGQATKEHGGLPTDDIIVEGSPGMQVKHARDLGIGADHVWSVAAPSVDDVAVREGGRMMGLGEDGKIPNDPPFGANRLDPGDHASALSGHGSYWDESGGEPSKGLNSMANVVVGHYDNVDVLPRIMENQ